MAALNNRGQSLKSQGRCQEALAYFQEAAALAPDDPNPHHQICTCYLSQLNQPQQAEEACRQALQRAPQIPEFRYKLAVSHLLQEEFPEAETWAQKTLDLAPERTDALNVLAVALNMQGKAEAGQIMRKLVEREPDKALYRKNYAVFLAEDGRCDQARAQFEKARELGADVAEVEQILSEACEEKEPKRKRAPRRRKRKRRK